MPGHLHNRGRRLQIDTAVVISHGMRRQFLRDLYHYSMTMSWGALFAVLGLCFVCLNLLFAAIYSLGDGAIANQNPAGFAGAFFFSVETMATVGYGDMHPQSLYAHVVATVEIFFGVMSVALLTGIMFSRFSRPRARVRFAQWAVVREVDGQTLLMIRAANARQNVIVDAHANLRLLRRELGSDGSWMRRVHDLKLVREDHPLFLLGWVLMHVIEPGSPLHGQTAESLQRDEVALLLSLHGIDESTSQSLIARVRYGWAQIRWNHRYRDLLYTDEDGNEHIDYARFDEVIPVAEDSAMAAG
ncbi:MAG: ion transporter [Nevskia sp.]|nr:ion transporter [Nevskia sp.]